MSNRITNHDSLATTKARRAVLDCVDVALDSIDTDKIVKNIVGLDGNQLTIQDAIYNIDEIENIYIIGFGKASCQAAVTLEEVLKENIAGGVVIGNISSTCEIIDTYHGSHPRPTQANVAASGKLVELSEQLTDKDLVIVVVSGGGSALLCWPASECDQGQNLYNNFLKTGGTIHELNTIRKHISQLKGGGLAKQLHPAQVASLVFSDIPGGEYNMIASGPTYYDHSTIQDAQDIVDKYNLGDFSLFETPKDQRWFQKVTNIPVLSNETAVQAMLDRAESLGYQAINAGNDLYLEPEKLVDYLTSIAEPNSIVIGAGEAKLVIPESINPGMGGRNTHTALLAAKTFNNGQVFCSLASDGIDNCRAAGAIIDNNTDLDMLPITLDEYLNNFDSYTLLHKLGDTLITGPTQSNVSDLYILLTP